MPACVPACLRAYLRACLPACLPAFLPARPYYFSTDSLTDRPVESKSEGPGVEEAEAAVVAFSLS